MAKTAYPAQTDLQAMFTRMGLTLGAAEAADAIAAAVDEFERRAGRKMIAEAVDRARRYDPPLGPWLDLGADLATFTSVEWAPQGGGAETLALNVDFWLESYNASADAEPLEGPYVAIRFNRRWPHPLAPADRRSIVVTGRWGFATSGTGFPEDAWLAMLHRGAARVLSERGIDAASLRTQRTEAGVQTGWPAEPGGAAMDRWNEEFEGAVRRYRRSLFG